MNPLRRHDGWIAFALALAGALAVAAWQGWLWPGWWALVSAAMVLGLAGVLWGAGLAVMIAIRSGR